MESSQPETEEFRPVNVAEDEEAEGEEGDKEAPRDEAAALFGEMEILKYSPEERRVAPVRHPVRTYRSNKKNRLTIRELSDVACKYNIDPKEFWLHMLEGESDLTPRTDMAVFYVSQFEAGLRLPLDPFINSVLLSIRARPSQLQANFIRLLVSFTVAARMLGFELTWSLFKRFHQSQTQPTFMSAKMRGGEERLFERGPQKVAAWNEHWFWVESR